MTIKTKRKTEAIIIVKIGQDEQFLSPEGHPCAELTKKERRMRFFNISGEIWARLCRDAEMQLEKSTESALKKS